MSGIYSDPPQHSGRPHYYNEWDAYAAQWLRNLIAAGHLPAGDVDTRSIADVQPDDLVGYTQCHFFAGIGGWALAARIAGWRVLARPSGTCWLVDCETLGAEGGLRASTAKRLAKAAKRA